MTQAGGWRLELKKVFFSEIHFASSFSKKKCLKIFFPNRGLKKNDLAKKWETSIVLEKLIKGDIYTPAAWGFGTW